MPTCRKPTWRTCAFRAVHDDGLIMKRFMPGDRGKSFSIFAACATSPSRWMRAGSDDRCAASAGERRDRLAKKKSKNETVKASAEAKSETEESGSGQVVGNSPAADYRGSHGSENSSKCPGRRHRRVNSLAGSLPKKLFGEPADRGSVDPRVRGQEAQPQSAVCCRGEGGLRQVPAREPQGNCCTRASGVVIGPKGPG